jgi:hypothetical protein
MQGFPAHKSLRNVVRYLTPIKTPTSTPRKRVKKLAASQSEKSFFSTRHKNIASL